MNKIPTQTQAPAYDLATWKKKTALPGCRVRGPATKAIDAAAADYFAATKRTGKFKQASDADVQSALQAFRATVAQKLPVVNQHSRVRAAKIDTQQQLIVGGPLLGYAAGKYAPVHGGWDGYGGGHSTCICCCFGS